MENNGKETMPDETNELKKLADIALDMGLSGKMRVGALEDLAKIGTNEALRILLDFAANEKLIREEREKALKLARDIIKSGH